MTELFFVHSLSVALAPGVAIECRAGEVMSFDEPIAKCLLRGPFVVQATSEHADARRRTHDERRVSDKSRADLIAPPHSEDSYIQAAEKSMRAAAARAYLAEQRQLGVQ